MGELRHIPLTNIYRSASQLRAADTENEQFIGILESLKKPGGVITDPINVRPMTADDADFLNKKDKADIDSIEDKFVIINGLQRTTASRMAGKETIPCQIFDVDHKEALVMQFIGNYHRVETKPAQFATHIYRILSMDDSISKPALAQKLGCSLQTINERLKLLSLTNDIQDLVDAEEITLMNAYELAKLPEAEQANYLSQATSMGSEEFGGIVKARVKELAAADREGRKAKGSVFEAKSVRRTKAELEEAMSNMQIAESVVSASGSEDAVSGFQAGIKFALSLDEPTVSEKKEKWEADEQVKREKKAAREKARREKKEAKELNEASEEEARADVI